MKLSKSTTYAVLALECLLDAGSDDAPPMRARQVAERLGIPTDSALKVLQTLARGGLLKSTLGRRGGYRPNAPAEAVDLLSVVELMDGPIVSDVPVMDTDDAGLMARLDRVCTHVREQTRQALRDITLADLMDRQGGPPSPRLADNALALAG